MDAGKKRSADREQSPVQTPVSFAIMLPNVFYDFNKVLLEKYFMWKLRHGY